MSFNLTVVFATAIVTTIVLVLLPQVFAQINGENKIISGNVTKLVKEAQALYNLGNYSQAIRYFDKLLVINPHNIYALTKKGAKGKISAGRTLWW